MSFWRNHTPAGMMLRSALGASDIASPVQGMTLAAYLDRRGALPDGPVPVSSFVDYGNWFQSRRLPDIDRRHVAQILTQQDGFCVVVPLGDCPTQSRALSARSFRKRTRASRETIRTRCRDRCDRACFLFFRKVWRRRVSLIHSVDKTRSAEAPHHVAR